MGLPKGARIAPASLRSQWNDSTLLLRNRLWGKWKLRPGLPEISRPDTSAEVRWYQTMLDQSLHTTPRSFHAVWDVGCRNWSYLPALTQMFPNARITGVEIDAGRRYWNLYRRHDLAMSYVYWARAQGHDVDLRFDDFRKTHLCQALAPHEAVLFAFFFPFVSEDPCLAWGLPRRYASFDELIRYAFVSSTLAGAYAHWLSIHQGEWEVEAARQALKLQGLQTDVRELHVPGWPSPHSIFAISGAMR